MRKSSFLTRFGKKDGHDTQHTSEPTPVHH